MSHHFHWVEATSGWTLVGLAADADADAEAV